MDLSVIVPCHNLESFITPLLVSLRLQIIEAIDCELIFICDACTDRTLEKINAFNFGSEYKQITIKEVAHHHPGLARNEGLDIAQGDIILFLDGDDYLINPLALHIVVESIRKYNIPIVRFQYDATKFWKDRFPNGHPSMVWQYAYTKELIGDTRFKKILPSEDYDFNKRIFKKINNKIPSIPNQLYFYNYIREGSIMTNHFNKLQEERS